MDRYGEVSRALSNAGQIVLAGNRQLTSEFKRSIGPYACFDCSPAGIQEAKQLFSAGQRPQNKTGVATPPLLVTKDRKTYQWRDGDGLHMVSWLCHSLAPESNCCVHPLYYYAQVIDRPDAKDGFSAYLAASGDAHCDGGLHQRLKEIIPKWRSGKLTLLCICNSSRNRYLLASLTNQPPPNHVAGRSPL